ncbi:MAG: hypothetical protein FWC00_02035 [Firmicutes bacterium]|nr:hypothetical protein [Bacillota bacterium]
MSDDRLEDVTRLQADDFVERLLKGDTEIMEASPLEKYDNKDSNDEDDAPPEIYTPDLIQEETISDEKHLDKSVKADIIMNTVEGRKSHGQSNDSQFERD